MTLTSAVRRVAAKVRWEVRSRRDPVRYLPMPVPDAGAVVSDMHALRSWIEGVSFTSSMEISIVTASKRRKRLLESAAESVSAQEHGSWQWCVVNDGPPGDLDEFRAQWSDHRISVLEANGAGLARARNIGLRQATGEVVVYLDDDNRFHPGWLRSLAFAAETGEWTWGYGVRVLESAGDPVDGGCSFPTLDFPLFLPQHLKRFNFIDANSIFHRNTGWRFDENTRNHSDWELALRLAETAEPLRLPALSALYATRHGGRMSLSPAERADRAYIRSKHSLREWSV